MGFREQITLIERDAPVEDIIVWQFEADPDTVGLIAAMTEGYDHTLLLRSNSAGGCSQFAIWAPPYFEEEVRELLEYWSDKYGFKMVEPHPFGPADRAFGMKRRVTENTDD